MRLADALFLHDLFGHAARHVRRDLQFFRRPGERDHDLGMDVDALFLHLARRLEDRAHLHLVDLRIGDAEAAAAMAEHRVHLVKLGNAVLDLLDADAQVAGQGFLAVAYLSGGLPRQYCRRWGLSRPCSGRERVVPPRFNHQEAYE